MSQAQAKSERSVIRAALATDDQPVDPHQPQGLDQDSEHFAAVLAEGGGATLGVALTGGRQSVG